MLVNDVGEVVVDVGSRCKDLRRVSISFKGKGVEDGRDVAGDEGGMCVRPMSLPELEKKKKGRY